MNRRAFFGRGALAAAVPHPRLPQRGAPQTNGETQVIIEEPVTGQPHRGKVLALITPHLDDGPIFAGGTLAKLLREGYTGYLIRTSNDEKDSFDLTLGETVAANEHDTARFVEVSGLRRFFDLSYRNHRMDDVARTELRGRLIFLFRLLKVDTVLSYDPWGHYEENPDHYVTGQAVEAACWMAGGKLDLPEHFAAGLQPHSVSEKYYFARGPQLVNHVVNIGSTMTQKMDAIRSCKTMIDHMIRDVQTSLADKKLRLPGLTVDEFIDKAILSRDRAIGVKHGLEYAEEFHYIGPEHSFDEYIQKNAEPLNG